jgi:hypothetical protein
MQFEVNGHDYFLNFQEAEARWYVLEPTPTGLNQIPVYVDAPKYQRIGILTAAGHKIPN